MARGCRERVRDAGRQDAGRSRMHGAGSVWSAPHLLAGPARVGYQDSKFKLNRARAACLRFVRDRLLWRYSQDRSAGLARLPRAARRNRGRQLRIPSAGIPVDVRTPRNPIRSAVGGARGDSRAAGRPGAGAGADRARPRRAHEGRPVEGRPRRRFHRQGQDDDRDPGPRRHRHPAAAGGRNGQGREGAGPAAARRLRAGPDRRPQGRGGQHRRRARRPRRGERGGVRRRSGARSLAAQLHLQEIPHHPQVRGRRRGGAARLLRRLSIQCAKPDAAAKAFAARKAVAEGVFLARDLVNEPANMLGPVEFAERVRRSRARRRRGRGAGARPARGAEDGRAARRRAGQRAARARRRHAVERRQVEARQDRCASSARACASIPAASR